MMPLRRQCSHTGRQHAAPIHWQGPRDSEGTLACGCASDEHQLLLVQWTVTPNILSRNSEYHASALTGSMRRLLFRVRESPRLREHAAQAVICLPRLRNLGYGARRPPPPPPPTPHPAAPRSALNSGSTGHGTATQNSCMGATPKLPQPAASLPCLPGASPFLSFPFPPLSLPPPSPPSTVLKLGAHGFFGLFLFGKKQ